MIGEAIQPSGLFYMKMLHDLKLKLSSMVRGESSRLRSRSDNYKTGESSKGKGRSDEGPDDFYHGLDLFGDPPDEETSLEVERVSDWLINQDMLPAAVTTAKRDGRDVILIFYAGEIDRSMIPTELPVMVFREEIEEDISLKVAINADESSAERPERELAVAEPSEFGDFESAEPVAAPAGSEVPQISAANDDKFSSDVHAVTNWLNEHNHVPSSVWMAKRGTEDVMIISYSGEIDTSLLPTRLPVVVSKEEIEQLGTTQKEAFHPYRKDQPGPGASIGTTDTGAGTLGMYLRDSKGNYYMLTCAHVLLGKRPHRCTKFMFDEDIVTRSPSKADESAGKKMVQTYMHNLEKQLKECKLKEAVCPRKDIPDYKKHSNEVSMALGIWRRRMSYSNGSTKLCHGGIGEEGHVESGMFHDRYKLDWAIAQVTRPKRVPKQPNQVLIGNHLFPFRSGFKDPKPGMIVCKVGRTTGLTFGRVSASPVYQLSKAPGIVKAKGHWFSALPVSEVNKLLEKYGGLRCVDGREVRAEDFMAKGDSGSIVLSYPDMTPVGMLYGGRLDPENPKSPRVGLPMGVFTPMRVILERIKKVSGVTFTLKEI